MTINIRNTRPLLALCLTSLFTSSSGDPKKPVLNLTVACGGMLVATDGRRLGGAPARVTDREFILASAAMKVLTHPDFLLHDATMIQPSDTENLLEQFRSGPCA